MLRPHLKQQQRVRQERATGEKISQRTARQTAKLQAGGATWQNVTSQSASLIDKQDTKQTHLAFMSPSVWSSVLPQHISLIITVQCLKKKIHSLQKSLCGTSTVKARQLKWALFLLLCLDCWVDNYLEAETWDFVAGSEHARPKHRHDTDPLANQLWKASKPTVLKYSKHYSPTVQP